MSNPSVRGLTLRYVFALGLIAFLSILAYVTLHTMASSQHGAAAVINVSGSQRWLSQRAAVYSLRLVSSHSIAERERLRQELLRIAHRLEMNHDALIHGNTSMNLASNLSPQIRAMYFEPSVMLDKQIRTYIAEINALAHDAGDKLTRGNSHLKNILTAASLRLILSQDAVVKQHQTEVETHRDRLQQLEKGVLGFTLFILFLEAFFIFRPMTARIQRDTASLKYSETHNRLIVDNAMDGIVTVTENGIIESFNPAAEKIFGYASAEVIGRNIRMVMPELHIRSFYDCFQSEGKKESRLKTYEIAGQRKHDTTFPMEVSLGGLVKEDQRLIVMILRDITEQKKRLGALEYERELMGEQIRVLSQAVEQSPVSVILTDVKGDIEYVNSRFQQLTGYTPAEAIGKNPRMLKSGKTSDETFKNLWKTITSGKEWKGEFINKRKNGDLYWESATISPVKDKEGAITHFLGMMEDVTERKDFEAQLEYQADNDPLTNLFNRRRFHKELERILAQSKRYKYKGALLFLDLDNFKYINDAFGHHAGDKLLVSIATLLRERLRDTDILARLGGDEFAIILFHTDAVQARSIAEEILELVQRHLFVKKDQSVSLSVSIGIALFPEHAESAENLLIFADLAMYKAKEGGRRRVCMYTASHKTSIESRMVCEKRIRDALENNRFELYLQPILNIRDNKVVGYEALLRMADENEDILSPSEFLDIAERFGLIHYIDRWVIRRAIHLIAEQQLSKKGLFLTVNLSSKAFSDLQLPSLIREELAETAVNPRNLIIEITEHVVIENMAMAQRFVNIVKSAGCSFALDDFGVGFSSFSYLKHLSVDFLKIDGSFVCELPHSVVDQHLVKAIVEVARALGKQTIAEFVGCGETAQLLLEYGVDYAQGFYIGEPCEVSEIFGLTV